MVATESLEIKRWRPKQSAYPYCLQIASIVLASLVVSSYWYKKAHPHEKWRIVVIFLYFCELSLTSYG